MAADFSGVCWFGEFAKDKKILPGYAGSQR
jgi:hypothetical protein